MSNKSIEARLTDLEKRVERLASDQQKMCTKDWRQTIGAFTGDEVMQAIFEEGRKIRQAERNRAQASRRMGRQ